MVLPFAILALIAILLPLTSGQPHKEFMQNFQCGDTSKAFSDFSVDFMILWNSDNKYHDPRFIYSIVRWVNWMKASFGEFRVSTGSTADDLLNAGCYKTGMGMTSNSSHYSVDALLTGVEFHPLAFPNPKSKVLAAALDASLDKSAGWNYDPISPKGRPQIRLILTIQDLPPLIEDGSDSNDWKPMQHYECIYGHRTIPTRNHLITTLIERTDTRILNLNEGGEVSLEEWTALETSLKPNHVLASFYVSYRLSIDEDMFTERSRTVWTGILCDAWRTHQIRKTTTSTRSSSHVRSTLTLS